MNIVLAGMPGSGKTTVAEVLKNNFGKTVVDTDAEIVKEHGVISEIFRLYGEEYFRQLETQAVKRACAFDNAVISTGGGCILRSENVKLFKSCAKIVFLRTQVETLLCRLKGDTTRPLLQGDTQGRLMKLYAERTPLYESAADITIDTDNLTPLEIAQKILDAVKD